MCKMRILEQSRGLFLLVPFACHLLLIVLPMIQKFYTVDAIKNTPTYILVPSFQLLDKVCKSTSLPLCQLFNPTLDEVQNHCVIDVLPGFKNTFKNLQTINEEAKTNIWTL